MKNLIVLIFLLTLIKVGAQTEPPTLLIDFRKIEVNQDSIINNYTILTKVLKENISFERINSININEESTARNNIFAVRDKYIYTVL